MNLYKLRAIIDFIRKQGRLPADAFGNTVAVDEMLAWYGLNDVLSVDEQRVIKRELAAMADAQIVIDQLLARAHAVPLL